MCLERKVRDLVEMVNYVYVMTGPLYEKEMPGHPRADEYHKIPSGYWKIILYEDNSGFIYTASFIFAQETPRNDKIQAHLITIDEIEQRSGLDFLWLLPDSKEESIESNMNKEWANQHFSE